MATKEDILEQIVEEYLVHKGYFVRHNVKFRPREDHPDFIPTQDSNYSDIDVIGYNPRLRGKLKVIVVSCKSWQSGFRPDYIIGKIEGESKIWKRFRELTRPKWSEAFVKTIKDTTGTSKFTYVTAVTHLIGKKSNWETHQPFRDALSGNPIKILTFREMVHEIQGDLTTTLAATEIGRIIQLYKAAGMKFADD